MCAPFSTHKALRLGISRRPRQVVTYQLARPLAPALPCPAYAVSSCWQEHWAWADQHVGAQLQQTLSKHPAVDTALVRSMGDDVWGPTAALARWPLAAESSLGLRGQGFARRAAAPTFRWAPIVAKRTLLSEFGHADLQANLWSCVASRLHDYQVALPRHDGHMQRDAIHMC